ncbi:MAG: phage replisome organizer N-terminal domain-containing protein, partial [Acutalibacteraceae bacterium]
MADVKWIKIVTDIFDDEKMLLIDGLPERDGIIVIWFKLLCMAGKQNNGGVFMLNDKIAYTDEMLATIFRRPLNTVRLALQTFEQFGMIEIINKTITIPNWEKHQSLDKLTQAKEKNRARVEAYRKRQKQLAECNAYSNVTVTQCNDTDKEQDKE